MTAPDKPIRDDELVREALLAADKFDPYEHIGGNPEFVKQVHDSDCSVHNEPAYPNELCNCGYDAQHQPSFYQKVLEAFNRILADRQAVRNEAIREHNQHVKHFLSEMAETMGIDINKDVKIETLCSLLLKTAEDQRQWMHDNQIARNEVLAEVKKFLDCHCEQEHFKQGCGASTCPRWCANRIDNIKSSADKG